MTTIDTNPLESLPQELLEKIVEHLPVLDILRMRQVRSRIGIQRVHTPTTPHLQQVKRGFYDLVRRSPWIQHRLDLAAVGLEPNWSTDFTLVERVKALEGYRSRWRSLDIDRYQTILGERVFISTHVVGGVYGILTEDEIMFFTLPSGPRAVEPRSHKIPTGPGIMLGYAFNPQADVVVVAVIGRFM